MTREGKPLLRHDSDAKERRRDNTAAILEAVAMSATELLRSADLEQCLPNVIARIGAATGADRVHILQIQSAAPECSLIVGHHLWCAPGIAMPPRFRDAQGPIRVDIALVPWLRRLSTGEVVVGHVRSFDQSARAFFTAVDAKSVVAVPVFAEGHWWGQIGLHDCRVEREWSPAEIDTLKTLAELIGAAVARARHLATLADASRIIESSPIILYRVRPEDGFPLIYLSQNIRRYGYEADAFMALPNGWLPVIDSEYHAAVIADFEAISKRQVEQTQTEFCARKPDGSPVWFEGRAYAVRDAERRLVAIEGILTDITERKAAAEKIAALARTDSLTGLSNRAAFLERLGFEFAQARRNGRQFAVHYLDLDHFKEVNDTLGHPVGDALLRGVAERLKGCVRETDMVARFGGDEFAVLQDGVDDSASIETLAAKIGRVLSAPFVFDGNQVQTSTSIGIVPYQGDIAGVDAMMMKADLALYRAKNEGRSQFRFHVAELDEQTRERIRIGDDLRHAIAREEFELYYQPQVELKSGRIAGIEALIRWNHPTRGRLLPSTFIPIAETTGSIVPIGEWVIERACRQIKYWNDLGIAPSVVGVNLSGAQFRLAAELDQIASANLVRYGIAPERLELELTESVLIETTERHGEAFERLRKIGVRLAIDDFGTGYSSLDYLRAFRVSRLKIHQRFIDDVTTSADNAAIVRATIGFAHELGIEVVAEGVETPRQRDFLIAAGCDFAQGRYFGMPMPAAAAGDVLRENLQPAAA